MAWKSSGWGGSWGSSGSSSSSSSWTSKYGKPGSGTHPLTTSKKYANVYVPPASAYNRSAGMAGTGGTPGGHASGGGGGLGSSSGSGGMSWGSVGTAAAVGGGRGVSSGGGGGSSGGGGGGGGSSAPRSAPFKSTYAAGGAVYDNMGIYKAGPGGVHTTGTSAAEEATRPAAVKPKAIAGSQAFGKTGAATPKEVAKAPAGSKVLRSNADQLVSAPKLVGTSKTGQYHGDLQSDPRATAGAKTDPVGNQRMAQYKAAQAKNTTTGTLQPAKPLTKPAPVAKPKPLTPKLPGPNMGKPGTIGKPAGKPINLSNDMVRPRGPAGGGTMQPHVGKAPTPIAKPGQPGLGVGKLPIDQPGALQRGPAPRPRLSSYGPMAKNVAGRGFR